MESTLARTPFLKLENPRISHPWGSFRGIPDMLGVSVPPGKPCAELWMGAHPNAPSIAAGIGPLDALIAADPGWTLGPEVASRFGALPFLFKGLSASTPLSIQAHPSKAFAVAGYERENALGIPLDAPDRTYRDRNHKPELAVALSHFTALCGFRPASEAAAMLGPALADALGFVADEGGTGLVRLVARILARRPLPERWISLLEERVTGLGNGSRGEREAGALVRNVVALHPGDPGILMPLILDLFTLEPGEGVYIPAGVLHAYVEGTALEIMANSDNVIRGGLTGKHVDAAELVRVLEAAQGGGADVASGAILAHPRKTASGRSWECPAGEFLLSSIDLRGGGKVRMEVTGPEILLCSEGKMRLSGGGASISLSRGESAFVAAGCRSYSAEGTGTTWRASVPPGAPVSTFAPEPPAPPARQAAP